MFNDYFTPFRLTASDIKLKSKLICLILFLQCIIYNHQFLCILNSNILLVKIKDNFTKLLKLLFLMTISHCIFTIYSLKIMSVFE